MLRPPPLDVFSLPKGRRSNPAVTSRYSSLLPSLSADVRSSDDVIAFEGSSLILYEARAPEGPWVRHGDLNPVRNASEYTTCQLQCHSAAATGADRCNHTIHGQLNSIGQLHRSRTIRGSGGGDAAGGGGGGDGLVVLAMLDRWMTAPGANPLQNASNCDASSRAKNSRNYVHGHDAQYWAPLQFGKDGSVALLHDFEDTIVVPMA